MHLNYIDVAEVKKQDQLLRKSFLDRFSNAQTLELENVDRYYFKKIKGLSNFWDVTENLDFDAIMGDLLSGMCTSNASIVFLLKSEGMGVGIYVGIDENKASILDSALKSSYPYIHLEDTTSAELSTSLRAIGKFGGIVTGMPTKKTFGQSKNFQIERLARGMDSDSEWAYVMIAKPVSSTEVAYAHEKVLQDLEKTNSHIRHTDTGGSFGTESRETVNFTVQRYSDNLTVLEQLIDEGRTIGMWRVQGYYLSPTMSDAEKLSALIVSIYNGDQSKPERVRALPVEGVGLYASTFALTGNLIPYNQLLQHPLGQWEIEVRGERHQFAFQKYLFQTIMTTNQLTTFIQIPRKEIPGYYIDPYVEFELAERRDAKKNDETFIIGKVVDGTSDASSYTSLDEVALAYKMDFNDLNRHGLIVGITGGGKSNTSKNLLRSLWRTHKTPFMVIESAKREYWELANMEGFEDVMIFTLGAEDKHSIPFRINPFEKIEGVPLQTHIDYVLSTFKASFDLFAPMPFVLETSIYKIYEDRGWDILENTNKFGFANFPTLDDLYYKVDVVVDELGYDQRLKSDITASLKARIHSLRVGGKGAMMNTEKSIPIESLLSKPVVLELEDIGDDDVKAFLMGVILIQLYEYRKSKLSRNKKFEHLILIEEAHRLLANVPSTDASPRAKSVEFFTNLLAEIRSYGQGFLIADQVPTKLAQDTLKNTNLKIVHRLVMKEDRELIGQAMNMSEDQVEYISSLKRGFAAVYAEGDTRPKLVQMPYIKEDYDLSRSEVVTNVRSHINYLFPGYATNYNHGPACAFCQKKCTYKTTQEEIEDILNQKKWLKIFVDKFEQSDYSVEWFEEFFNYLQGHVAFDLSDYDIQICLMNIILNNVTLEESRKRELVILFMKRSLVK